MPQQELCQEKTESSVKEVAVTQFKPQHTSTQRKYPSSSVTQDLSATVSFAPYTLPSLKTIEPVEVEEKTQTVPCEDGILKEGVATKLEKEGPHVDTTQEKNLNFDEWWKDEGAASGRSEKKRVRDDESPQQEMSKKNKCDERESNFSSENIQDNHNDGRNKRQILESDEVLFSLPPRAKRRAVSAVVKQQGVREGKMLCM